MTLGYHYLDRFFAVQEMSALGYTGTFEIREGPFTERRFNAISEALSPGKSIQEFRKFIERRWAEVDELRRKAEAEAAQLDTRKESQE